MIHLATYLDAPLDELARRHGRDAIPAPDDNLIEVSATVTDYPNASRIPDVVTYEVW